jgi:2-aminoadipate transaminase
VIAKLVQLKQSADLHTSTFTQMVTYEVARDGFMDEHVKLIRATYKERRDAMLAALQDYFPPEVSWTHPQGGLFLWVTMPPGVDSSRLLESALRQDVAFVPGHPFYPNGDEGSHMRLNFSNAKPEMIREGVRRLSIAVAHALEHRTAAVMV